MKSAFIFFSFLFFFNPIFSQEKTGIFKGVNIKAGLTMTYYHSIPGEYVYLLQQDAHVKEEAENRNGGSVSVVIIIPMTEKEDFNLLLNLPIVDLKGNLTDVKESSGLFNSQTPFGLGFGYFPFKNKNLGSIGFNLMANYIIQNRLRDDALKSNYFPIADYPNYNLRVNAPVPEAVLKPFLVKSNSVTINAGLIFKL